MQHDQETGEIARDLDAQIWSAVNSLSENNWHIGELLVRMRDQQFYKDLNYKSCRAYLQAHENTIGLRRAYDVMRIVGTFDHVQHAAHNDDEKARIRAKLVQSDATKLVVLSRIVNRKANHDAIVALVDQAQTLTRAELRSAVNAEIVRRDQAGDAYTLPTKLDTTPIPITTMPESETPATPVGKIGPGASLDELIVGASEVAPYEEILAVADEARENAAVVIQVPTESSVGEKGGAPKETIQSNLFGEPPFPLQAICALTQALKASLSPQPSDVAQARQELKALVAEIARWQSALQRS